MTKSGFALICAASAAAALGLAELRSGDWLLYNPSPSMPTGLYRRVDAAPGRGAIVTARSLRVAPDYARVRGFADANDRFIKRVAATGGDVVCATGAQVWINAREFERALSDANGRPLPTWNGCATLQRDEFFLMGEGKDSFDSRYFGPVDAADIEGVWVWLGDAGVAR